MFRKRRYYDEWAHFAPSRPLAAKGGIKAQSKRGSFGQSWWAQRWIKVLESFHIGSRLQRGRSYARGGQVLSIEIEKSAVTAKVQGSRPKPYNVTIRISPLSSASWKKLTGALSRQTMFAAKLLSGEMLNDIETVFPSASLSLFPESLKDLKTDCSCPDWSNPCKHVAAVYYLLGEEFDRDPFLIFKMRGMERQHLVLELTQSREKAAVEPVEERVQDLPEPLTTNVSEFWAGQPLPEDLYGEVQISSTPAALPKRLGNFPFWRGGVALPDAMAPAYDKAAQRGAAVFLGEGKE